MNSLVVRQDEPDSEFKKIRSLYPMFATNVTNLFSLANVGYNLNN